LQQQENGVKENYKLPQMARRWRVCLTLKAENWKDTFSKGIMDKWLVLHAHNSLQCFWKELKHE
jgi:hypothetical protein